MKSNKIKLNESKDSKKLVLHYAKTLAQYANLLEDLNIEKSKYKFLAKDLEKFKLALDNISDNIIITDPKANVIYVNKAVEKTTGYKPKEVIGKKSGTLWKTPMPLAYYQKLWDIIKKQKKVFNGEVQNKRKNGEVYTAIISISPVFNEKGEIEFFVSVERDITKEKEIDRSKSEFISLASHQLKTPPTAIKLLTERLLSDKIGTLTEKQKEYFNDIRSLNQRMIDLINTLLNMSRIELGLFSFQIDKKDACMIMQDVVKELELIIKEKQLKFKMTFQEKHVILLLDESLFRIVIDNLIMNAIRYTRKLGEIRIECRLKNKGQLFGEKILKKDSFTVIISDNGCGISQTDQRKMFTKFFRGDNAKKKHTDGTGLGLYMVKSILDHSGGSIWFTSRENIGSTFYVAIPMTGMKIQTEKDLII